MTIDQLLHHARSRLANIRLAIAVVKERYKVFSERIYETRFRGEFKQHENGFTRDLDVIQDECDRLAYLIKQLQEQINASQDHK